MAKEKEMDGVLVLRVCSVCQTPLTVEILSNGDEVSTAYFHLLGKSVCLDCLPLIAIQLEFNFENCARTQPISKN